MKARSVICRGIAPVTVALCALVLGACGSSSSPPSSTVHRSSPAQVAKSNSAPAPAVDELAAAQDPSASDFPPTDGRSLQQLGRLAKAVANFGSATGTFTPGEGRVAFALTDKSGRFVYAPTAIYIASSPNAPAKGPYVAPADLMTVAAQYRSEQNAGPNGIEAIYGSKLPVPAPGVFDLLALTRTTSGLIASAGEIAAAKSTPIPGVGQRPPAISTLTPAAVHGNIGLLTTRVPPEQMHSVSFREMLGKQPIALLFSTPELCTSRVCGPVTDVMVSLQHEFANQITFIHQEIYVNNDPSKGLRPQMKAFHLETEPWLFTINRQGIITARLEGAFGVNEARQAVKAALG